MFHETVRESEASDGAVDAVVGKPFEDGRTESSRSYSILYCHDTLAASGGLCEEEVVERLEVAHIVVSYGETGVLGLQLTYDLAGRDTDGSECEDGNISTFLKTASASYRQCMHRTLPVGLRTASARIAYGKRSAVGLLSCEHEVTQFVLIHRRCNDDIRYRTKVCQVESPMVCGTVLAHESGTVEAEDYV